MSDHGTSVRRSRMPGPARHLSAPLIVLVTLVAVMVPQAAAAGVPTFNRPVGLALAQGTPDVSTPDAPTLDAPAGPGTEGRSGWSSRDDANECPRDADLVRHEPSAPPQVVREAIHDAVTIDPASSRATTARVVGEEPLPEAVYRCNPDGRGPPGRR